MLPLICKCSPRDFSIALAFSAVDGLIFAYASSIYSLFDLAFLDLKLEAIFEQESSLI